MLKALLKKQFMELNAFFLYDAKRKIKRTGKGLIYYLCLWAVIFLLLAFSMFGIASVFAQGLLPLGLDWVYFAMMGIVALLLGVFGGVFNTYQGLYRAKDNDFLLSLPIPPRVILATKLLGVYAMGLLYESLVFLPAILAYILYGKPTVLSVFNCLLLDLLLGLAVLTFTCLLGFILALVMGKLKNKNWLSVVISLGFIVGYYYFCMNYMQLIQNFIADAANQSEKLMHRIYPAYLLGQGASGHPLPMLYFTLGALALFALTWLVMEKTFLRLAILKEGEGKGKGKLSAKEGNAEKALFKKEWKRFSGSTAYMLNCGMGVFFAPVGGVALLIFSGRVTGALAQISALLGMGESALKGLFALGICIVTMMIASSVLITAPSVSLEGESLWIVQSLPVDTRRIMAAKLKLHLVIALPGMAFLTIVSASVLKVGVINGIAAVIASLAYTAFIAYWGLELNLKHPNLSWTNETVPVKQGFPVFACLMGGWGISAVLAVGGFFAMKVLPAWSYLLIVAVLFGLLIFLLRRFIMGKGCRIFGEL